MLGFRPSIFWRVCWKYVTPGLMSVILGYTLFTLEPLKDGDRNYPQIAYVIGWCISALGLIQLPIFAIYAIYKQKGVTMMEVRIFLKINFTKKLIIFNQKFKGAFKPTDSWGPREATLNAKYKEFISCCED